MHRFPLRRLLAGGAIALAALTGTTAQAGPYSSLFVFGDSLSDNGNNYLSTAYDPTQVITGNSYIPSATYASKVYSNGPVWASYFAGILGLPLTPSLAGGGDYAFGGATTGTPGPLAYGFPFDLKTQTGMFLAATNGQAPSDALYVVAGGGNNARAALAQIQGGAPVLGTIASFAAAYAADIASIVGELEGAGAKHIVVWDVPNLGLTPAITAAGGAQLGTALASQMNAALAQAIGSDPDVTTFDVFGIGTKIVADPAAFGFTDVSDACGAVAGADCSKYAYWDGIHPTTAVHALVANDLAVALNVPEPQTYALLALGLVAVVLQRRRGPVARARNQARC